MESRPILSPWHSPTTLLFAPPPAKIDPSGEKVSVVISRSETSADARIVPPLAISKKKTFFMLLMARVWPLESNAIALTQG